MVITSEELKSKVFDENGDTLVESITLNDIEFLKSKTTIIENNLGANQGEIFQIVEQIKENGILRGGDIRKFTELGFPLILLLSYELSYLEDRILTIDEVFKKISKGEDGGVSYDMVIECTNIYIEYICGDFNFKTEYPCFYKNVLWKALDKLKYLSGLNEREYKLYLLLEQYENNKPQINEQN